MRRRTMLQLGVGGLGAAALTRIGRGATSPGSHTTSEPLESPRQWMSLDGEWRFELDPQGVGEAEHWYFNPEKVQGTISVPGCWQAQGYGEPAGFLKHHYIGPAWYLKEIEVPREWQGRIVDLVIGGAFTYVTAFVNGIRVGEDAALTVPYRFGVTSALKPGQPNLISLRVANKRTAQAKVDVKESDVTEPRGAGNWIAYWGGLRRSVGLEAREAASVEDLVITTSVRDQTAHFRVRVRNDSPSKGLAGRLEVRVSPRGEGEVWRKSAPLSAAAATTQELELRLQIPNAKLWTPEEPNLYRAQAVLYDGDKVVDELEDNFGLREIGVDGTKLLLNGKPFYLRGYGDDSTYVIDGIPPTSKEVYAQQIRAAKSFGFNGVRFHSWVPANEFFEAADELGLLVMAELPVAYEPLFLPNREFLKKELVRIVQTYRNHPSWMSLALGNEFFFEHLNPDAEKRELFLKTVQELVALGRQLNPTRPMLSNDGYLLRPTDIASLYSGFASDIPTIKHEFGTYCCSLPDVDLASKFTGVMIPRWLQGNKDWLQSQGLLGDYSDYLRNSWRLLHVARKSLIEGLRGVPEITGYHYWLFTDLPEEHDEVNWDWGWCNYFWEPKGITPEQGREINSPVLPLIGLKLEDRTMWAEESKCVPVFVSNYGPEAILEGKLEWELRSNDNRLGAGGWKVNAPLGAIAKVGEIQIEKVSAPEARELELRVSISAQSHTYTNLWKLWAFPRQRLLRNPPMTVFSLVESRNLARYFPIVRAGEPKDDSAPGVLITSELSLPAMKWMKKGGRLLVLADKIQADRQTGVGTYLPQPFGGALGIKVREHPALLGFPHNGFPDLQFFNLFDGGSQFELSGSHWRNLDSPKECCDPIIDGLKITKVGEGSATSYNAFSYFALLFEARVGAGGFLLSTLNIQQNLDDAYPEVMYLLGCLLRYVTSAEFKPEKEMTEDQLSRLVVPVSYRVHAL